MCKLENEILKKAKNSQNGIIGSKNVIFEPVNFETNLFKKVQNPICNLKIEFWSFLPYFKISFSRLHNPSAFLQHFFDCQSLS